jgi:hypothetical protein
MTMIVEMRTYKLKPGTRPKILEVFHASLFPECKRIGMKVAGPFPSIEDETTVFWMRGFPDAAARQKMSGEFYGGKAWASELSDAFMPNMESYSVVAVEMPENAVKWV